MSTDRPSFTGERIVPGDLRTRDEALMYVRHVAAYERAAHRLRDARAVLEVGSGEGYGAALLASRGLRVIGVEIEPVTVAEAKSRHGGPLCRFLRFDGRRLPFPDSAFKGLLSLQVIEHVEQDERFVLESSRVVAPGGLAIFTTPNATLRLHPGQRPWNRYHVREYDAAGLANLLRRGFDEVEVQGLAGSAEIEAMELARLRRIRTLARLDPLRLRRLVPDALEHELRRFLRRRLVDRGGDEAAASSGGQFTTADFHLTDAPGRALDLFAVCRR